MPLSCTFRWSSFNITMTRSTAMWYWWLSDDHDTELAGGKDGDPHVALSHALEALDAAVKREHDP